MPVYKRVPRDPMNCPSCYNELSRAQYLALMKKVQDEEAKERKRIEKETLKEIDKKKDK